MKIDGLGVSVELPADVESSWNAEFKSLILHFKKLDPTGTKPDDPGATLLSCRRSEPLPASTSEPFDAIVFVREKDDSGWTEITQGKRAWPAFNVSCYRAKVGIECHGALLPVEPADTSTDEAKAGEKVMVGTYRTTANDMLAICKSMR